MEDRYKLSSDDVEAALNAAVGEVQKVLASRGVKIDGGVAALHFDGPARQRFERLMQEYAEFERIYAQ
jgi:hypothetical protein